MYNSYFYFQAFGRKNGIWFAFAISKLATLIFICLYSKYITKKMMENTRFFLKKKHDENEKIQE